MKSQDRSGERVIALVIAVAAALVISITAGVVLNITFRRFELSAQRSDHTAGLTATEGATRYLFIRFDLDPVFEARVRTGIIADGNYILSPEAVGNIVTIRFNNVEANFAVEEQIADLQLGRPVHVLVDFEPDPTNTIPNADRRFRLHASADFGIGL